MKKLIACDCGICRSLCTIPCLMLPREAKRLIDIGYAPMLEKKPIPDGNGFWLVIKTKTRTCVIPQEQRDAADHKVQHLKLHVMLSYPRIGSEKQCFFQNDAGHCILHNIGLKPLEGRIVVCKTYPDHKKLDKIAKKLHYTTIPRMWENDEGKTVNYWKEKP